MGIEVSDWIFQGKSLGTRLVIGSTLHFGMRNMRVYELLYLHVSLLLFCCSIPGQSSIYGAQL